MIDLNTKTNILLMHRQNYSQRQIAKKLGIDRKTVARYIKKDQEYNERLEQAENGSPEQRELMGLIAGKPVYNNGKKMKRERRKLTPQIEKRVEEILEDENREDQSSKSDHKSRITSKKIHEMLLEEGFDICYTTINELVKKKRNKYREVLIKQC